MSDAPIPATVLAGFLGSGKTTLLNHLLRAPHGLRIAVVVNEFGSVGVDGALVSGDAQFVELDNGCLCCALNADLDKTLRQLLQRGHFDHIVVETTGLADPLPVAWSFNRPGLSQAYRIDAIVTVVDAAALPRALAQADEARVQLQRADVLVLNKLDLVADDGLATTHLVRQHNTVAPILHATAGAVAWDLLLAQPAHASTSSTAVPPAVSGHHAHRPSFDTWAFESDAIFSELALEDFLNALPSYVYRLKGFVRTDAPWDWTLVNMVAGRIDMRPATPTRAVRAGLVFIGPQLDIAALQRLCRDLTQT